MQRTPASPQALYFLFEVRRARVNRGGFTDHERKVVGVGEDDFS